MLEGKEMIDDKLKRSLQVLEALADELGFDITATPKKDAEPKFNAQVEEIVEVLLEAEKTSNSPTVFTIWHHYAKALIEAGYSKEGAQPPHTLAWANGEYRDASGNTWLLDVDRWWTLKPGMTCRNIIYAESFDAFIAEDTKRK
jgi:hypothetical protein